MKASDAKQPLAAAVGRIPSGLFIITLTRDDIETGMLASWVQQCSFEPLLLTIAVQKQREFGKLLNVDSECTINILDDTQTDMIAHFGKGFALGEPAFTGVEVLRGESNGPILSEALAFLSCRIQQRVPAGDHELVVAEVEAGRMLNDGQPMIHVRKNGLHY